MASFEKRKDGRWRVFVARAGVRRSKILPTKQAAKDWAARQEYLILNAKPEKPGGIPFSDVLDRYASEVSPTKRGERWELLRLARFQKEEIAQKNIGDLTPADLAAWRDARLSEVSPGTVAREMTLLSGVLSVARKEWGLIEASPMTDVRKPSKPPPRDRIATADEMERLALSAGDDLTTGTARSFHAFLFAVETAMRAGEIVGLTWDRVDLDQRVVKLTQTKNGTAREVPLSSEAVRLLKALPRTDPVFDLTSRQLDALWRKLRDRAAVEDLTFHDSRHIAITRLAGKLEVLELARMVGHRNLSELLTYYNTSAADLAKRLE
jgi:integrase